MDFEKSLSNIAVIFEKEGIRYGLIGGYAMGLYGVIRATADLDFLFEKKYQSFLKNIMKKNLYDIIYESDNVIQFEHPTGLLGNIDFLYAFRDPSLKMLDRAVRKSLFEGKIILPVILPEDIIGLKVQSFVNNPKRKVIDLEDIKNLMEANSKDLDWNIIEEHFKLFDLSHMFKEFKNEYL